MGVMDTFPGLDASRSPSSPSPSPSKMGGLPVWAIVLIIVIALMLIAGGIYASTSTPSS